jgi:hypothetical protein
VIAADPLSSPSGYADGSRVPVTLPAGLVQPDRHLRRAEREARTCDALAVRVCAGLFEGSMRALARANGISVQRLSKRARVLATRLGIRLFFLSDRHRESLAHSQRERWRKLKTGAAVQTTPEFCEAATGMKATTCGADVKSSLRANRRAAP